ncbi:hypothetical protein SY88_05960 [Clostridiales bacterium PH28_bin88]|nr:hypothetical protein SY88_05960 [Clostridiales bacterium PH28_bin88]
MNGVFTFLVVSGILVAAFTGNMGAVTSAALNSATSAVERILGLIGVITLWLGVARIAERSGLLKLMTVLIQPLVGFLFPSVPRGHPAMGAMLMNMSANLLGFGSAATPFGLKAMGELQRLNPDKETASEAMCTFLAINTSSVTIIPATVIALRAAAGSINPAEIVTTTLFATTCSTLTAVIADYWFRRRSRRKKWR